MHEKQLLGQLSPDRPLKNPEQDLLGYASFAEHLAGAIESLGPLDGLVIAIYGPWGSGKSTVLNFVEHFLRASTHRSQAIIVHFNPWWFSSDEDLARRFFAALGVAVGDRDDASLKIRSAIAEFADALASMPIPYKGWLPLIAHFFRPKTPDIHAIRARLEELLGDLGHRIVVVIDDLDRLSGSEVRQMFRLIKAVANLPNVTYLTAFDKSAVAQALEELQPGSGHGFLDKIVQIPFELPMPEKDILRKFLFRRLDAILNQHPSDSFDTTYWANVYHEGIDPLIVTPRDVVRLTNTLAVTYPAAHPEVNPIDFIAVEALRVFLPGLYDIIRSAPESFVGLAAIRQSQPTDPTRAFHDGYIHALPAHLQQPMQSLLRRLFPRLDAVWHNSFYSPDHLATWRKAHRICTPEYFPVYFRLELPQGEITSGEIKSALALSTDPRAFALFLRELASQTRQDGTSRARALLQRLEDFTSTEIPVGSIPPILEALFDVADEIRRAEPDRVGIFDLGISVGIGRVIYQLVSRLPQADRKGVLTHAIDAAASLATIVDEVTSLGQLYGKYGSKTTYSDQEKVLTLDEVNELEAVAERKIRAAAEAGTLKNAIDLPSILERWRDWSADGTPDTWFNSNIQDDTFLATFLTGFLGPVFRQSITDVVATRKYRISLKWLRRFLDPLSIRDRVENLLLQPTIVDRQREALKTFLEELTTPQDD